MHTDLTEPENASDTRMERPLAELREAAECKYRLNKGFRPLLYISILYSFGRYLSVTLSVTLLHLPVPEAYMSTLALVSKIATGILSLSWMPEFFLWKRVKKDKARLKMLVDGLGEDSRTVGALAQLCRSTEMLSVADIALEPLLRLLPDVKASDARFISDSQMEALLELLAFRIRDRSTKRGKELPLAVLKAFERIGDTRAIEPVRRLTTGRHNRLYHQAAQQCLTVLEQQGEERDYHRSLLLPSSLGTAHETLLRPTIPKPEAQPELLLRAVAEKERECTRR